MSTQPDSTTPATPVGPGDSGARSRSRRRWVTVVAVAFLLTVLVRALVVQSFYIPSGSMEPTLEPGDRILVSKVGGASTVHRGDVVVFDGTTTFGAVDGAAAPAPTGIIARALGGVASALSVGGNESDYVKRVVGMPGDHVVCCDDGGNLTVNDRAVTEPYLYAGDEASDLTFDVRVPAGRIWLMGDHRSDSADSRAHLGDPGGGMVRLEDVIGRAEVIYWPPARAGAVGSAAELAAVPAPAGQGRR
jgi:signal peptidase I